MKKSERKNTDYLTKLNLHDIIILPEEAQTSFENIKKFSKRNGGKTNK